jgi:hypothetical protein
LALALAVAALGGLADAARRKDSLIYSRFDVDPGEWRYFEFPSKAGEARLEVRFEVLSPKDSVGVRVRVQRQAEFDKFRENRPHQDFQATSYLRHGALRAKLAPPGDYVVVVDNRREAKRRYRVDLEVTLTTGPDPETLPVAYASGRKRTVVVVTSIAGFLLILLVVGRALWRATRRVPDPPGSLWA